MKTGLDASLLNIHLPTFPFLFTNALYIHSPNGKGIRIDELPSRALLGGYGKSGLYFRQRLFPFLAFVHRSSLQSS